MKDNIGLGVVVGIGMMMFNFLVFTFSLGIVNTSGFGSTALMILQWLMLPFAIGVGVVFYVKGLRKAMKAYLLTILIPIVLVLLLFGSCLMILR